MRAILTLTVLLAAAFAGCTGSEPGPTPDDLEVEYEVPEVPGVDAGALLADLQLFSGTFSQRADNLPDHEGARDWLADRFAAAGLDVWRQEFESGIAQENIVGVHWGEVKDEWVVVGAHYDMVTTDCAAQCVTRAYSEGAYDDGSGTLMTVHLAEAFANVSTYYTIAFVAFDGEERGLRGSGAFVEGVSVDQDHPFTDEAGDPLQVTFRGMVDLDMIGLNWPGVDAPVYFDHNSPEMKAYIEGRVAELGMPAEMIKYQGISLGRSDYAHFMDKGVPTGFFISDFEEWQLPADLPVTVPCQSPMPECTAYPFWHLEDTWDTMVLMAGSEEDLRAGFQTAVDLAGGLVHFLSADPETTLTVA